MIIFIEFFKVFNNKKLIHISLTFLSAELCFKGRASISCCDNSQRNNIPLFNFELLSNTVKITSILVN